MPGNAKGNWFDAALLVSPFDLGCEDRFAYAADGSIRAKHAADAATQTTIAKLKLDCDKLRSLRKGLIDGFLKDDLTDDEMRESILAWLGPDGNGNFGAFYTTVMHLFGYLFVQEEK